MRVLAVYFVVIVAFIVCLLVHGARTVLNGHV